MNKLISALIFLAVLSISVSANCTETVRTDAKARKATIVTQNCREITFKLDDVLSLEDVYDIETSKRKDGKVYKVIMKYAGRTYTLYNFSSINKLRFSF